MTDLLFFLTRRRMTGRIRKVFPERKEPGMTRRGLQKRWVRILLTGMTAVMMVLIFCFSMEPAEQSDETSGSISRTVISVIHPDYPTYPTEKQRNIYDTVQHYVRKTAHFTEYLILGLLIRLCLESWFGKQKWLSPVSWAAGTLYAGTDELHQLLTDGRSGQWRDVLIDSSGVLTGVLIAMLALHILRAAQEKRGSGKKCP